MKRELYELLLLLSIHTANRKVREMHRYLRKLMMKLSGNLKLIGKCLNMNKESALMKVKTIMLTIMEMIMNWLTMMETTVGRLTKRILILVLKTISQKVIANKKLVKRIVNNRKIKPKMLKRTLAQRISLRRYQFKQNQKLKKLKKTLMNHLKLLGIFFKIQFLVIFYLKLEFHLKLIFRIPLNI